MRYSNKLKTSLTIGAVGVLAGLGLNNLHVAIGGFGLMSTSYYALDDINTNQDEFADIREEMRKRDRLVKRALETYNMI